MNSGETIYSVLRDAPAGQTMVVDGDDALTYAQVRERVDRLAAWMSQRGVRAGDRVVLQLPKCVEEVFVIYACARLGAAFVDVHPVCTAAQVAYFVGNSQPALLVCPTRMSQQLKLPASTCTADILAPSTRDEIWSGPATDPSPLPDVASAGSLAALLYTSGATGRPKGVMHSQANLVAFGRNVVRYLGNTSDDRILGLLPLSFGYGLNQLLSAVECGATYVVERSPLATDIVASLQRRQITGLGAVPSMWRQIVDVLKRSGERVPSLRYLTNSGEAPSRALIDDLRACLPTTSIFLMFGATEALRSTYLPPADLARKPGAIGQAVPGVEVFVLTEDGRIGGPGDRGELLHRGDHTMLGYWQDPEATARKLKSHPKLFGDERPLLHTEDHVRIDDDGCLWFESRADWMIKRNGFRYSLPNLEEAAGEGLPVVACATVAVPDAQEAQRILLMLIPRPGDHRTSDDYMRLLRKQVPGYMLPDEIVLWPDAQFPHTPNGKLDRQRIRQGMVNRGR